MSAIELDQTASAAPVPLDLARTALFLDLDGTLAPIAETPDGVTPERRRSRLLARLAERMGGRVAVISGRPINDVDRILERSIRAVAGVHGLERRTADGEVVSPEPHPKLAEAREAFRALARASRGLIVEDKGLSVALHYRQAPEGEEAVRELAHRLADATGLRLQEGHMVAELRTPGPGKEGAVAAYMAEPPFAGAVPVYVGDDLTDEDGFAAAARAGGFGVLVGPERRTRAKWRLADVEQVLAWLGEALEGAS